MCVFQVAGCPHPSVLSQVNISNATCMNVFIDHVSELSTSTVVRLYLRFELEIADKIVRTSF